MGRILERYTEGDYSASSELNSRGSDGKGGREGRKVAGNLPCMRTLPNA